MRMQIRRGVWPTRVALGFLAMTIYMPTFADAAERQIPRSALPPAVEKTVLAQSEGATIQGFTMERENGKATYEAEMTVNGRGRDVEIAADGTVLEIEQEVTMDSLPAAAKSAILSRAGSAKIVKVESVTKNGMVVSYETATISGTKRREIAVGLNGEKVPD